MNIKEPLPTLPCPLCGAALADGLLENRRVKLDLTVRIYTPLDRRVLPDLAHNTLSYALHADVCPYRNA